MTGASGSAAARSTGGRRGAAGRAHPSRREGRALQAAEALEQDHDAALKQWRLQVERARYQAEQADAATARSSLEHRLVARGLERDWENALQELAKAEAELTLREQQQPRTLTDTERQRLLALGADLGRVWSAPTTTDRDRKQLIRCLIEEVIINVERGGGCATALLTIRWRGGAITELAVTLPKPQPAIRTDEDTIELIRRLAAHYDDGRIAGILNRQGRRPTRRAIHRDPRIVGGLRRYRGIPAYTPPAEPPDGELLPVGKCRRRARRGRLHHLPLAASRVHPRRARHSRRALADPRQRPTPRAVRRGSAARLCADRRRDANPRRGPADGVQRVKRGQLQALHVRNGRRKGLRILVPQAETSLFDTTPMNALAV